MKRRSRLPIKSSTRTPSPSKATWNDSQHTPQHLQYVRPHSALRQNDSQIHPHVDFSRSIASASPLSRSTTQHLRRRSLAIAAVPHDKSMCAVGSTSALPQFNAADDPAGSSFPHMQRREIVADGNEQQIKNNSMSDPRYPAKATHRSPYPTISKPSTTMALELGTGMPLSAGQRTQISHVVAKHIQFAISSVRQQSPHLKSHRFHSISSIAAGRSGHLSNPSLSSSQRIAQPQRQPQPQRLRSNHLVQTLLTRNLHHSTSSSREKRLAGAGSADAGTLSPSPQGHDIDTTAHTHGTIQQRRFSSLPSPPPVKTIDHQQITELFHALPMYPSRAFTKRNDDTSLISKRDGSVAVVLSSLSPLGENIIELGRRKNHVSVVRLFEQHYFPLLRDLVSLCFIYHNLRRVILPEQIVEQYKQYPLLSVIHDLFTAKLSDKTILDAYNGIHPLLFLTQHQLMVLLRQKDRVDRGEHHHTRGYDDDGIYHHHDDELQLPPHSSPYNTMLSNIEINNLYSINTMYPSIFGRHLSACPTEEDFVRLFGRYGISEEHFLQIFSQPQFGMIPQPYDHCNLLFPTSISSSFLTFPFTIFDPSLASTIASAYYHIGLPQISNQIIRLHLRNAYVLDATTTSLDLSFVRHARQDLIDRINHYRSLDGTTPVSSVDLSTANAEQLRRSLSTKQRDLVQACQGLLAMMANTWEQNSQYEDFLSRFQLKSSELEDVVNAIAELDPYLDDARAQIEQPLLPSEHDGNILDRAVRLLSLKHDMDEQLLDNGNDLQSATVDSIDHPLSHRKRAGDRTEGEGDTQDCNDESNQDDDDIRHNMSQYSVIGSNDLTSSMLDSARHLTTAEHTRQKRHEYYMKRNELLFHQLSLNPDLADYMLSRPMMILKTFLTGHSDNEGHNGHHSQEDAPRFSQGETSKKHPHKTSPLHETGQYTVADLSHPYSPLPVPQSFLTYHSMNARKLLPFVRKFIATANADGRQVGYGLVTKIVYQGMFQQLQSHRGCLDDSLASIRMKIHDMLSIDHNRTNTMFLTYYTSNHLLGEANQLLKNRGDNSADEGGLAVVDMLQNTLQSDNQVDVMAAARRHLRSGSPDYEQFAQFTHALPLAGDRYPSVESAEIQQFQHSIWRMTKHALTALLSQEHPLTMESLYADSTFEKNQGVAPRIHTWVQAQIDTSLSSSRTPSLTKLPNDMILVSLPNDSQLFPIPSASPTNTYVMARSMLEQLLTDNITSLILQHELKDMVIPAREQYQQYHDVLSCAREYTPLLEHAIQLSQRSLGTSLQHSTVDLQFLQNTLAHIQNTALQNHDALEIIQQPLAHHFLTQSTRYMGLSYHVLCNLIHQQVDTPIASEDGVSPNPEVRTRHYLLTAYGSSSLHELMSNHTNHAFPADTLSDDQDTDPLRVQYNKSLHSIPVHLSVYTSLLQTIIAQDDPGHSMHRYVAERDTEYDRSTMGVLSSESKALSQQLIASIIRTVCMTTPLPLLQSPSDIASTVPALQPTKQSVESFIRQSDELNTSFSFQELSLDLQDDSMKYLPPPPIFPSVRKHLPSSFNSSALTITDFNHDTHLTLFPGTTRLLEACRQNGVSATPKEWIEEFYPLTEEYSAQVLHANRFVTRPLSQYQTSDYQELSSAFLLKTLNYLISTQDVIAALAILGMSSQHYHELKSHLAEAINTRGIQQQQDIFQLIETLSLQRNSPVQRVFHVLDTLFNTPRSTKMHRSMWKRLITRIASGAVPGIVEPQTSTDHDDAMHTSLDAVIQQHLHYSHRPKIRPVRDQSRQHLNNSHTALAHFYAPQQHGKPSRPRLSGPHLDQIILLDVLTSYFSRSVSNPNGADNSSAFINHIQRYAHFGPLHGVPLHSLLSVYHGAAPFPRKQQSLELVLRCVLAHKNFLDLLDTVAGTEDTKGDATSSESRNALLSLPKRTFEFLVRHDVALSPILTYEQSVAFNLSSNAEKRKMNADLVYLGLTSSLNASDSLEPFYNILNNGLRSGPAVDQQTSSTKGPHQNLLATSQDATRDLLITRVQSITNDVQQQISESNTELTRLFGRQPLATDDTKMSLLDRLLSITRAAESTSPISPRDLTAACLSHQLLQISPTPHAITSLIETLVFKAPVSANVEHAMARLTPRDDPFCVLGPIGRAEQDLVPRADHDQHIARAFHLFMTHVIPSAVPVTWQLISSLTQSVSKALPQTASSLSALDAQQTSDGVSSRFLTTLADVLNTHKLMKLQEILHNQKRAIPYDIYLAKYAPPTGLTSLVLSANSAEKLREHLSLFYQLRDDIPIYSTLQGIPDVDADLDGVQASSEDITMASRNPDVVLSSGTHYYKTTTHSLTTYLCQNHLDLRHTIQEAHRVGQQVTINIIMDPEDLISSCLRNLHQLSSKRGAAIDDDDKIDIPSLRSTLIAQTYRYLQSASLPSLKLHIEHNIDTFISSTLAPLPQRAEHAVSIVPQESHMKQLVLRDVNGRALLDPIAVQVSPLYDAIRSDDDGKPRGHSTTLTIATTTSTLPAVFTPQLQEELDVANNIFKHKQAGGIYTHHLFPLYQHCELTPAALQGISHDDYHPSSIPSEVLDPLHSIYAVLRSDGLQPSPQSSPLRSPSNTSDFGSSVQPKLASTLGRIIIIPSSSQFVAAYLNAIAHFVQASSSSASSSSSPTDRPSIVTSTINKIINDMQTHSSHPFFVMNLHICLSLVAPIFADRGPMENDREMISSTRPIVLEGMLTGLNQVNSRASSSFQDVKQRLLQHAQKGTSEYIDDDSQSFADDEGQTKDIENSIARAIAHDNFMNIVDICTFNTLSVLEKSYPVVHFATYHSLFSSISLLSTLGKYHAAYFGRAQALLERFVKLSPQVQRSIYSDAISPWYTADYEHYMLQRSKSSSTRGSADGLQPHEKDSNAPSSQSIDCDFRLDYHKNIIPPVSLATRMLTHLRFSNDTLIQFYTQHIFPRLAMYSMPQHTAELELAMVSDINQFHTMMRHLLSSYYTTRMTNTELYLRLRRDLAYTVTRVKDVTQVLQTRVKSDPALANALSMRLQHQKQDGYLAKDAVQLYTDPSIKLSLTSQYIMNMVVCDELIRSSSPLRSEQDNTTGGAPSPAQFRLPPNYLALEDQTMPPTTQQDPSHADSLQEYTKQLEMDPRGVHTPPPPLMKPTPTDPSKMTPGGIKPKVEQVKTARIDCIPVQRYNVIGFTAQSLRTINMMKLFHGISAPAEIAVLCSLKQYSAAIGALQVTTLAQFQHDYAISPDASFTRHVEQQFASMLKQITTHFRETPVSSLHTDNYAELLINQFIATYINVIDIITSVKCIGSSTIDFLLHSQDHTETLAKIKTQRLAALTPEIWDGLVACISAITTPRAQSPLQDDYSQASTSTATPPAVTDPSFALQSTRFSQLLTVASTLTTSYHSSRYSPSSINAYLEQHGFHETTRMILRIQPDYITFVRDLTQQFDTAVRNDLIPYDLSRLILSQIFHETRLFAHVSTTKTEMFLKNPQAKDTSKGGQDKKDFNTFIGILNAHSVACGVAIPDSAHLADPASTRRNARHSTSQHVAAQSPKLANKPTFTPASPDLTASVFSSLIPSQHTVSYHVNSAGVGLQRFLQSFYQTNTLQAARILPSPHTLNRNQHTGIKWLEQQQQHYHSVSHLLRPSQHTLHDLVLSLRHHCWTLDTKFDSLQTTPLLKVSHIGKPVVTLDYSSKSTLYTSTVMTFLKSNSTTFLPPLHRTTLKRLLTNPSEMLHATTAVINRIAREQGASGKEHKAQAVAAFVTQVNSLFSEIIFNVKLLHAMDMFLDVINSTTSRARNAQHMSLSGPERAEASHPSLLGPKPLHDDMGVLDVVSNYHAHAQHVLAILPHFHHSIATIQSLTNDVVQSIALPTRLLATSTDSRIKPIVASPTSNHHLPLLDIIEPMVDQFSADNQTAMQINDSDFRVSALHLPMVMKPLPNGDRFALPQLPSLHDDTENTATATTPPETETEHTEEQHSHHYSHIHRVSAAFDGMFQVLAGLSPRRQNARISTEYTKSADSFDGNMESNQDETHLNAIIASRLVRQNLTQRRALNITLAVAHQLHHQFSFLRINPFHTSMSAVGIPQSAQALSLYRGYNQLVASTLHTLASLLTLHTYEAQIPNPDELTGQMSVTSDTGKDGSTAVAPLTASYPPLLTSHDKNSSLRVSSILSIFAMPYDHHSPTSSQISTIHGLLEQSTAAGWGPTLTAANSTASVLQVHYHLRILHENLLHLHAFLNGSSSDHGNETPNGDLEHAVSPVMRQLFSKAYATAAMTLKDSYEQSDAAKICLARATLLSGSVSDLIGDETEFDAPTTPLETDQPSYSPQQHADETLPSTIEPYIRASLFLPSGVDVFSPFIAFNTDHQLQLKINNTSDHPLLLEYNTELYAHALASLYAGIETNHMDQIAPTPAHSVPLSIDYAKGYQAHWRHPVLSRSNAQHIVDQFHTYLSEFPPRK